jgi:hypothetical protein
MQRAIHRKGIVKMLKVKDKEKILKQQEKTHMSLIRDFQ